MATKAVFEGLVFDENDQPVQSGWIGSEPCYIVDDAGFMRHIPAEQVDRQVWQVMQSMIEGERGSAYGKDGGDGWRIRYFLKSRH